MINQQDLSLDQRFKRSIDYWNEQKETDIETERAKRQNEALRLERDALQENEEVQRHSLTSQTSQRSQRINRSDERTISELNSNNVTLKTSRSASLSTFSTSFIIFKKSIKMTSVISSASTTKSQDIAHLHVFLQDRQSKIDSLNLKLKDTQNELQCFCNQRQKAFNEYLHVICEDVEEKIEKYKRWEKRLMRMMKKKKQIIERLEKEIDEKRERKRELRERLTKTKTKRRTKEKKNRLREMKRRAKERKNRLRETKRRAKERKNRLREAKKDVDDDEHAEVENKKKKKSKRKSEKWRDARAKRMNWEFRRKKREKKTSSRAMY